MKRRLTAGIIIAVVLLTVTIGGVGAVADNYPKAIESDYKNTGDMRYDIVEHALSQVGYTEGAGDWNVYGNSFGNPSGAWCAYFVRWCAQRAGVPSSIIPESRFGRVADYWENASSVSLEFHPVNDFANPYTPKMGDLVIYRQSYTYYDTVTKKVSSTPTANSIRCRVGRTEKIGGTIYISHIGLVAADAPYPTNNGSSVNNANFKMVDGNWNSSVASRYENYRNITGFVSIKYKGSSNVSVGSWPVLSVGSTGRNVSILQSMLNATVGAKLDIDGEFGYKTAVAVKRFQQWHQLDVDGMVGPKTWEKLIRLCQSYDSYNWSTTRTIQAALRNKFGLNIDVDGHYGSQTRDTVRALQRRFGLEPDGIVGPETWRVIICGRVS